MRHLKRGRKLGRNAPHRTSLKRNLLLGLFAHERITTTVPKAMDIITPQGVSQATELDPTAGLVVIQPVTVP